MEDFFRICFFIFAVNMTGFVCLKAVYAKLKLDLRYLSLLYGIGAGVIALEMFFMSLANLRFSLELILLPWFILLISIFLRNRRVLADFKGYLTDLIRRAIAFNRVVAIIFVIVLLPVFLRLSMNIPLNGWDAWAHWGLKAKIFYFDKHFSLKMYMDPISIIPLREYPLLVNLIQTFFYNCLGRFDDSLVRVVFFTFYLSLLLYFYSLVKEMHGKWQAVFFTFFLATTPMLNDVAIGYYCGYADLPLLYFNFISVTLLWLWQLKKERSLFYLSSIFTGFALFTKQDGIVVAGANGVCLLLAVFMRRSSWKAGLRDFFIYTSIIILIAGAWYSIIIIDHFPRARVMTGTPAVLSLIDAKRWHDFGAAVLAEALTFSSWNICWLAFIPAAVLFRKKLFNETNRFLFINLSLQMSAYCVVVIMSKDFYAILANTIYRLMLHLMPLLLVVLSCAMCTKKQENRLPAGL